MRHEESSHAVSAERFGPQIDDAYEEDLKECRKTGHEPRIVVCPRCGQDFGEIPDSWYDQ